MNVHSHYENLKVSRDAPPEVIRAAYKALSMLWHPDRSTDPRAPGIMRTINVAYEVLGDPIKRHEHDEWLAAQELQWTLNHPQIQYPKDGETWHVPTSKPQPARKAEPKPEPEVAPEPVKKRGRAFDIDEWLFKQAVPATRIRLPLSSRVAIGACAFFGFAGVVGAVQIIFHR